MSDQNLGAFTGRLGHTPELRDAGGTPVVNVSIAVNCYGKGGEKTAWVPCVFFGKTAETLAEYRGKGDQIAVTGRWEPHEWTGKDGAERKELRLIVGHLALLARSQRNEAADAMGGEEPATGTTEAAPLEDDIPFS